jgi:hypothetical protein
VHPLEKDLMRLWGRNFLRNVSRRAESMKIRGIW